jgi:translation initiation factor IF-3
MTEADAAAAPLFFWRRRAAKPGARLPAPPGAVIAGATKRSFTILKKEDSVRVNERIRIPNVRVVDEEGNQVGILTSREALAMARERGLDLVEVSPMASPPVCRIMDYGKFKYETSKRANKDKKKQHRVQVKEVKFKVKIDDHDFSFKVGNARKFLDEGNRVKFTLAFRGREISHAELGRVVLDRAAKELEDVGIIESPPRLEGFAMTMYIVPRKDRPKAKEERPEEAAAE